VKPIAVRFALTVLLLLPACVFARMRQMNEDVAATSLELRRQFGDGTFVTAKLQDNGVAVTVHLRKDAASDEAIAPLIKRVIADHFHEPVTAVTLIRH
jgi:hypothetical protein